MISLNVKIKTLKKGFSLFLLLFSQTVFFSLQPPIYSFLHFVNWIIGNKFDLCYQNQNTCIF